VAAERFLLSKCSLRAYWGKLTRAGGSRRRAARRGAGVSRLMPEAAPGSVAANPLDVWNEGPATDGCDFYYLHIALTLPPAVPRYDLEAVVGRLSRRSPAPGSTSCTTQVVTERSTR